jgi:hypothetical protein
MTTVGIQESQIISYVHYILQTKLSFQLPKHQLNQPQLLPEIFKWGFVSLALLSHSDSPQVTHARRHYKCLGTPLHSGVQEALGKKALAIFVKPRVGCNGYMREPSQLNFAWFYLPHSLLSNDNHLSSWW